MKYIIFSGVFLFAGSTGITMAGPSPCPQQSPPACSGTSSQRIQNLGSILPGKKVCGTSTTEQYDDGTTPPVAHCVFAKYQEEHRGISTSTSGELWDVKKGPNHPIDPSIRVGTWTLATNGRTVSYNYDAFNPPYNTGALAVYQTSSGNYQFCSGTTSVTTATIVTIGTPCP